MIGTIEILILVLILFIYEYRQQHQIKIFAKREKYKLPLAITISLAVVVLFWPSTAKQWIQIILISLLFVSTALFRQGLGTNRLVTYSAIGTGSKYVRFHKIILADKPDENGNIEVRFMKTATLSVDVVFNNSYAELLAFLSNYAGDRLEVGTPDSE